jgi:hypothetical protein
VETYRRLGVRWVAARETRISHDTVTRLEVADPVFAAQVEAARQEFADSLEQNLDRLAKKKDNVIANIVMAKKHRPEDFIERRQELHLHAHAQVGEGDARQLLAAMLAHSTGAPREPLAIAQLGNESSTVLEAGRSEESPLEEGPPA